MDAISRLHAIVLNHVTAKFLGTEYLPYAIQLEKQIIFEMIKDFFIKSEHNPAKTIRKHCGSVGNEETIKQYSRYLKYADYYRTINNAFLKGYTGTDNPELTRQPMTNLEDHFKGVKLSEYQFLQLDCIRDIPLLRAIISKRITDNHKISNEQLHQLFDGYREILVYIKFKSSGNDDIKQLMWAFNFFSLESRYQVLSVYQVASLLSEYNNCKSKEQFSDNEKAAMLLLFGIIVVDKKIIIENTLLLIRLNTISQLRPGNVADKVGQYIALLQLKSVIKHTISQRPDVQELLSSLTLPEIRQFIDEEYNLIDLLNPKFEWGSKKELFIRELYDRILRNYPAPPIK